MFLRPPLLSALEEWDCDTRPEPSGGLGAGGELDVGFPSSAPPALSRTPGTPPSALHLTLLSFLSSWVAPAGAKAF